MSGPDNPRAWLFHDVTVPRYLAIYAVVAMVLSVLQGAIILAGVAHMSDLPEGLVTLTWGLVNISVCVPADWAPEQIETAVNLDHPTGISSRWTISENTHFASGQTMPCECEQGPARKHWLLHC